MTTLREALEQSPSGRASNTNQAWGYAGILGAKQLPDGRVEVTVYEMEGEFNILAYENPEAASSGLFTDTDFTQGGKPAPVAWDGADEWRPEANSPHVGIMHPLRRRDDDPYVGECVTCVERAIYIVRKRKGSRNTCSAHKSRRRR